MVFYKKKKKLIMQKKLLFNLTEDWFFCSHFLDRALAAKKNGYNIYVCCKNNNRKSDIEKYGFKFISLKYKRSGINPIYELYILINNILIYKSIKPDIVHHISAKPIIYGSIAARICNIKSVINAPVGLGYVFTSDTLKSRFLKPILKILMLFFLDNHHGINKKNKVIFENRDDLNYFLRLGALRKEDSCIIRGAGVKIKKLRPKKSLSKLITVTVISRMIKDKGIYEFISAARDLKKENPETRFLLAGDIDSQNPSSLKRETLINWNNEGIIEWLGWVDDIEKLLLETDIVCLPSYREGLPKALLEAAAFGLPIVTTDTVGCRDVVKDGVNGFLVPIKNVDELVNKIGQLLKSKLLRERMGEESLKMALNLFSEDIIISQTLEIYKELSF